MKALVPTAIVLAAIFMPALARTPAKHAECLRLDDVQIATVGLYATILIVLFAVRYLQAGVDRAHDILRRGQRGDL